MYDSKIIGERIKLMLPEIDGISILGKAKNSKDALGQINYLKPHVVLLDIKMGEENGADLLVKVKQQHPDLMVIMLSNFSYPYYRKLCMDRGADHFFDKSTEFENILDLMKQFVSLK